MQSNILIAAERIQFLPHNDFQDWYYLRVFIYFVYLPTFSVRFKDFYLNMLHSVL